MNNKNKAVLALITAGVTWGVLCIFIKKLSALGLDAMQITFLRELVTALTFVIFLLIKDPQKLKINIKDIWIFILNGCGCVAMASVCYFYTTINGEASIAEVLMYTSPVFVMIMSAIFFKEKITPKKIIAVLLTFTGVMLVAGIIGTQTKLKPIVFATGLLSGFFCASYSIVGSWGLNKYDVETVTAWTFIMAAIGMAFFVNLPDTFGRIAAAPAIIPWTIGIGIICTVIPFFMYTWGLKYVDASKAAIIVAIEPVIGSVLGMALYNESTDMTKILGIVLIIFAIILLNLNIGEPKGTAEGH